MSDFRKKIQKAFGEEVYFGTLSAERWSTGVYALDKALGMGLPAGKMSLLVGKESTGKSTISAKVAGKVNSTNYKTGKYCEPDSGKGCKVLYVDAEGTCDRDWCAQHDYFPEENGNIILSTNTGNQAIDIITAAFQSREFSFIILDSIEALIPYKDLERSSEDFVMGTKAKLMNSAYRVWQVAITEAARNCEHWWQRPTLLAVNQLRDSISSVPAPPTIPGGIGQKQFSSIIIQMNAPKYSDDGKLASKVELKGVIKKNKVSTPRGGFSFEMAVQDLEDLASGQVDNVKSIIQDVRKHNLWVKDTDGMWDLFGLKAKTQGEFQAMLLAQPDLELDIMNKVIAAV